MKRLYKIAFSKVMAEQAIQTGTLYILRETCDSLKLSV